MILYYEIVLYLTQCYKLLDSFCLGYYIDVSNKGSCTYEISGADIPKTQIWKIGFAQ